MSRRRVGGVIKKGRGAKLALREEDEVEKEVNEDVEDTKKAKEPVKTKPIAKKGGKVAVQQEQILLVNENENTTRHVKELEKQPPTKCPNKNADRVCVCEDSEHEDYLSLICGKCHSTMNTAEKEKHINSSFVGCKQIDLSEIELKTGLNQQCKAKKIPKIGLTQQNCLTIQTMPHTYHGQYYLDYQINPNKKYILKFRITSDNNQAFFFGLMRRDQVSSQYMYSGSSGWFFKRFSSPSPQQDCSKVLQGKLFGNQTKLGDSFEMRFCIEDQILEFSTLPDHENVVSKLEHAKFDTSLDAQYVITLVTHNSIGFSFDSLQESLFLPTYS